MNTDQLRLFLEIARQRSLSRAAVRLDLAQATVSERLRALEAEVGTRHAGLHGQGRAPRVGGAGGETRRLQAPCDHAPLPGRGKGGA